ncbi:MAG: MCP four helix bundle domain-containing protein [Deltaproteobacteria bacterium]|nr:MCP four helix bundle domain-containing protein [Deltaproteobacteria bacterium]
MKNLTIKAKIIIGFVIVLLMMAGSMVISIKNLAHVNNMLDGIVESSAEKVKLSLEIVQDALNVIRAEKNVILSETQEDITRYAAVEEESKKLVQEKKQKLLKLVAACSVAPWDISLALELISCAPEAT